MPYTSGIDLSLPGDYSSTYSTDPTLSYGAGNSYNMYPSSASGSSGGLLSANGAAGIGGAAIGSYDNASTDTTGSVLGGAASGAMQGFAVAGPWGAVAGGVIGAISGYFGSKSKKKAAKDQFKQAKELAVAQIQENEKNYQLHQQQLKDAYKPYAQFGGSNYQFTNGLLKGGNQPAPTMPQQAPQGQPAPQGVPPSGSDPAALAAYYAQLNQQQQAGAMAQYGGLLRG